MQNLKALVTSQKHVTQLQKLANLHKTKHDLFAYIVFCFY